MSLTPILGEERKLGVIRSFLQVKILKKWQSQVFDLDLSGAKASVHNHCSVPTSCSCQSTGHLTCINALKATLAEAKIGAHPARMWENLVKTMP